MQQKNLVNFHGYLISDNGNIYTSNNYLMMQFPDKNGYKRITLFINGKYKKFYVHRLIYECHVNKIFNNDVCRHMDGNLLNNNVKNLAVGTQKQNINDKLVHGTWQAGNTHPKVKYDDDLVQKIQIFLKINQHLTLNEIANKFSVPKHFIFDIKKGKRKTRLQRIKDRTQ